ncbi:MAG: T9SS type A sorting domain-containing protein [Flavobacteriales bacterium]|jgi:hypothetical protein|nr:T9SS type A sorting domain-containing protein [Flavobacteriales bacterium]MCB0759123.1 T9SS type A sorting domain-containing protein [Flavobacteriales bacterium]
MITRRLLILLLATGPLWSHAQVNLTFDPAIPVSRNGVQLGMPWAGGLNAPQISPIDLDQDGIMDLFLFDRSGDKPIFLLNTGTADQPLFTPTREYDHVYPFPLLHDWALLRDYNCDGKADIFAYTNGAFGVYRNTSDASGLSFTLVDDQVGSNYVPTISPNLYISNVDLPGIADIDGDGDMDVLTFSIWGNYLEYHKNLSMELYGTCDSLTYEVRSRCWGDFRESVSGNTVELNVPCSDNVPNPEMPPQGHDAIAAANEARAHSGSTILPLDLDGDGDMDLILGDFLSPNLTALINGGTVAHASMISADSLFPVYDQRVYFEQFLSPFLLDIDGDGKRDLVVAPNSTTAAENAHGTWYYRNTGTDSAPVFQFQQNDLFQRDMLEFGEGARPVLFDHNGDGLMDLVVANEGYFQPGANYQGRLALLENTGTATAPAFNMVSEDYGQLAALGFGPGVHPGFGDVNGDGRPEMILGDAAGNLHLFNNTSSGPVAQFQLAQALLTDDVGTVIDVGANATPQLFDLDSDGLLDLIIGERNGNLNYYRNSGTAQVPIWHLENANLGGVRVNEYWSTTGYSVPFLQVDNDGGTVCYSGSEVGGIHRYEGITGNVGGTWNLTDSVWEGLDEGIRTAVALYDFTGDGELDAVVGNYRGGLSFWSSGIWSGIDGTSSISPENAFSLAPNPAARSVDILMHIPVGPDVQVELFDDLGRTVRNLSIGKPQVRMDLESLSPGLYTMRLVSGNAQWNRRLVVVR